MSTKRMIFRCDTKSHQILNYKNTRVIPKIFKMQIQINAIFELNNTLLKLVLYIHYYHNIITLQKLQCDNL